MRTAVVRVDVDPAARLTATELHAGMTTLATLVAAAGGDLIEANLANLPAGSRQVEVLLVGDDRGVLTRAAVELCCNAFGAFGVMPEAGVLTFVSRGTDDDAYGVLAGLGLDGDVRRVEGGVDGPGWDTVHVTLRKCDLERVPESRVHTALEASLNCEVCIHVQ